MDNLKQCKCGTPVRVCWRAGFSPLLANMLREENMLPPLASSRPKWYILCEKCGLCMVQEVQKGTYEEQQKNEETDYQKME